MSKTIAIIAIFLIIIGVAGVRYLNSNKQPITELNTCVSECEGDRSKYIVKIYENVETKGECDALNGIFRQLENEETYCQVR